MIATDTQIDLHASPIVDIDLVRKDDQAALEPLQARLPARTPAIEDMLMEAVRQKVDPASIEKLVAVFERVQDRRAEQAFISAIAAFKTKCPAIIKNRDARNEKTGKVMYSYADLSEITKIIDPLLLSEGLSYTWDTEDAEGRTTIICRVSHVNGHSRTAKFTCKPSGTSIMSNAQIEASAVTFGKRQSLVCALGLTVDDDDDGRRAAPMPRPDHDPAAPKVGTRAERAAQAQQPFNGPRPTIEQLKSLYRTWQDRMQGGAFPEFLAWARQVIKTDAKLEGTSDWTMDGVEACQQALEAL